MARFSSSRPAPPEPIDGHAWRAFQAGPEWRLIRGTEAARRCRAGAGYRKGACGRPAVAALNRGRPHRENWWAYCADDLYGRWIEDGRVMEWRLIPEGEDI